MEVVLCGQTQEIGSSQLSSVEAGAETNCCATSPEQIMLEMSMDALCNGNCTMHCVAKS